VTGFGTVQGEQPEPAEHRDRDQIQQSEQHGTGSWHDHRHQGHQVTACVTSFGTVHVSGVIKFDDDSGEPTNKRNSLLYVEQIPDAQARPVEVFHCGRAHPNDDPTCRPPSSNTTDGFPR
jgi:hypothetical protein